MESVADVGLRGGNEEKTVMAATKMVRMITIERTVPKNSRSPLMKVRSRAMVARMRIISPRTSTTTWVIAMSGALRKRNIREPPKPMAPTQITALSRLSVSTAIIAATSMNSSRM